MKRHREEEPAEEGQAEHTQHAHRLGELSGHAEAQGEAERREGKAAEPEQADERDPLPRMEIHALRDGRGDTDRDHRRDREQANP
jgi:hypothetical protein